MLVEDIREGHEIIQSFEHLLGFTMSSEDVENQNMKRLPSFYLKADIKASSSGSNVSTF